MNNVLRLEKTSNQYIKIYLIVFQIKMQIQQKERNNITTILLLFERLPSSLLLRYF